MSVGLPDMLPDSKMTMIVRTVKKIHRKYSIYLIGENFDRGKELFVEYVSMVEKSLKSVGDYRYPDFRPKTGEYDYMKHTWE